MDKQKIDSARAAQNLEQIRATKPLVHNITNFVVMNFTANALLAVGASPVMAHAPEEVEEMVGFAKALVLNIGTLDSAWIATMLKAGKKAAELGVPVVLDPVGAGATRLRTEAARRIIDETEVTIVRANASEMLALAGKTAHTKGVDASDSVLAAEACARDFAREWGITVAITGPVDYITDGWRIAHVANGHPLMGRVTGTGCTASALVAAFAGVDSDPVSAGASGLAMIGLAGEVAAEAARGPGSFVGHFLDSLYSMTGEDLLRGGDIREGEHEAT